ncbi:cytochrome P450 6a8-like [Euwallacea similis]|uniref:cytochrome P450 6a8-like n=1 Tax=Euwallacea similis TaxID=1736056 RepID=UPI00344BA054
MHSHFSNVVTTNLFNLDGEKWRSLRPKLTLTSVKMNMMFETIMEKPFPSEKTLEQHEEKQKSFAIKGISATFIIDIIGSCTFGIECNSTPDQENHLKKYGEKTTAPQRGIYRKDFIQLPLELKNQLSEDDIIALCFVFFLTGFETSSTAMIFAL